MLKDNIVSLSGKHSTQQQGLVPHSYITGHVLLEDTTAVHKLYVIVLFGPTSLDVHC